MEDALELNWSTTCSIFTSAHETQIQQNVSAVVCLSPEMVWTDSWFGIMALKPNVIGESQTGDSKSWPINFSYTLPCLGERNQTGYTTLLEQEKIKFKMAYPYGQVTMLNVLWIKLQMVFDVFHYNQQKKLVRTTLYILTVKQILILFGWKRGLILQICWYFLACELASDTVAGKTSPDYTCIFSKESQFGLVWRQ